MRPWTPRVTRPEGQCPAPIPNTAAGWSPGRGVMLGHGAHCPHWPRCALDCGRVPILQLLTGWVASPRASRQKKTMKLSRALSDLVKYTKSVGAHDVDSEGEALAAVGAGWCRRGLTPTLTCAPSGLQLAGVLVQRDSGTAHSAAEAGAIPALQPAPAQPHLPLILPSGLQQLQPAALLECWLPHGCVVRVGSGLQHGTTVQNRTPGPHAGL